MSAEISAGGLGSSFATARIASLNSPVSTVTAGTIAFLPGLEAHRKVRVTFTVGAETVEFILELLDEVFETETVDGRKKERA